MKRLLISSVAALVAIGFLASCADKKETMRTTNTEPVKKETTTKKSSETRPAPAPSPAG